MAFILSNDEKEFRRTKIKYDLLSYGLLIIIVLFLLGSTVLIFYEESEPLPTVLTKHNSQVSAIAFSHDGNYFVSGDKSGIIILWDMETRKSIKNFRVIGEILSLDFSPDGEFLGSGSIEEASVWKLPEGTGIFGYSGDGIYHSIKFSPDSKIMAISSLSINGVYDGIKLFQTQEWTLIDANFLGHQDSISNPESIFEIAFSPDQSLLVSCSGSDQNRNNNSEIIIWDTDNWVYKTLLDGHIGSVFDINFNNNGDSLISAGEDGKIIVWDLSTSKMTGQINTSPNILDWTTFAVYSPDSSLIASNRGYFKGSTPISTNSIDIWDAKTLTLLTTLIGHENWVSDVGFSKEGNTLISASWDKTIRFWNLTGI